MDTTTLLLAGDVMTGRGVDQVLGHPVEPGLYEMWVRDARDYVRLAERANGPIGAPVAGAYLWGDALPEIERAAPDAFIVNLETAVTTADRPWPGKGIHYRMNPANIDCLRAARIDACALANNHVLDWGGQGLAQTVQVLVDAGVRCAGAGANLAQARAPAVLPLEGGHRLLVFSWAARDSGVPDAWTASEHELGIALLHDFGERGVQQVAAAVDEHRREGDLVVISLHWGANWVDAVPQAHRHFAHELIDLDLADLVHGHSAHHPLPFELHRGKLVLYGCGDLINDYEGIASRADHPCDVACLFFATLSRASGRLVRLRLLPLQRRAFRLVAADAAARASIGHALGLDAKRLAWPLQWRTNGHWVLEAPAPHRSMRPVARTGR
jgi:poly-gamma-glutamate synthesis protein (capsule biosynthesis protein)